MGAPTVTPNIGLQIPAFGQANWQVPTNYNWNLLDKICGGAVQIPALSVVDLTVTNLVAANIVSLITNLAQVEPLTPSTGSPTAVWTLAGSVNAFIALFVNGQYQAPTSYFQAGSTITFKQPLVWTSPANVWAIFLGYPPPL
jgi:hypothetical protein